MQRHHRLAQARDRALDHLVGALHLLAPRRGLHQLLVGGEQALQRVVVDQLGDPPAAVVLGLEHLGEQLSRGRQLVAKARVLLAQLLASRRRHYSSMPRRIPSATAAARSETPSFS